MLATEQGKRVDVGQSLRRLMVSVLIGTVLCGFAELARAQTYSVVVDAGSTGSRVYVYKTDQGKTRSIYSKKLDDALAGPHGLTALKALLALAHKELEKQQYTGEVPASVLGTAGMRLLAKHDKPKEQAIYEEAKTLASDFGFTEGKFRTISGAEEGLFAWSAVNDLKATATGDAPQGIVEVGGASAQIAFAAHDLDEKNTFDVELDGKPWRVFSMTFLGLGQEEAGTQKALSSQATRCDPESELGYNVADCKVAFGKAYEQHGVPDALKISLSVLDKHRMTAFSGLGGVYHALEFARELGAPASETFDDKIEYNCKKEHYGGWSEAERVEEKKFHKCERAAYISTFVHDKLRIAPEYLDGYDASWTLGYLITRVNREPEQ